MLTKNHLIVLLLVITSGINAQNFKYGKVSKEELEEKENNAYPDADATVLNRSYKVSFEYKQGEGFNKRIEVLERIKIYNTDGFNWATKKIKTQNELGGEKESFGVKGVTYTLENGSVKKSKLDKSGIFEQREGEYWIENTFTMPNLQKGCVVEYEYTIESPFANLRDIDLQYTIPIRQLEIKVEAPDYYVYNIQTNPKASIAYSFNQNSKEKKITIRGKSGLGTANYDSGFRGMRGEKGTFKGDEYTYKENIYTMEERNIPPLKVESHVDNLRNYQARSLWELSMINWPGEIPKRYATSWEAVAKSIYERDVFENQLSPKNYYAEDVENAIANLTETEEKMAAIFAMLKNKVRWNSYDGYFPSNGGRKAYREGEGNVADINLMLISMLKSVNIEAYPVLVSTKKNGIPVYPTREGFNYVIAAVKHNGAYHLMDASSTFSNINMLPEHAMNWQGRLIRPDGTSDWIGLYPSYVSKKLTYVQAEVQDNKLIASIKERKGGNYAKDYRVMYANSNDETQINAIETNDQGIVITDFEAKDLQTLKNNMSVGYTATSSSIIEEIGGDLYLSPMLFMAQSENPFKDDIREYPIFFNYPKSHSYNISIKIPEGYQVKSMPEAVKANLANNMGSYTYLVKEMPGMIQLAVSLDINTPVVIPQDYEFIKAMFSQIVEKEKEKVVFSKI